MRRFKDERTEEVFLTGFAAGVPEKVSRQARKMLHVTLAAGEVQDLTLFGDVIQWTGPPVRFGLAVSGKWHITFLWPPEIGAAVDIRLERR